MPDPALRLLRDAVTDRWESVDDAIRRHAQDTLGDPLTPATPAWHLRHIVEIFRVHAAAATRGGIVFAADIPADPAQARNALLRDVDAFIDWVDRQTLARLEEPIEYGGPKSLEAMIGIMLRHVVWHAAAVHYRATGVPRLVAGVQSGPTPSAG
jgi:hypothetical protein